MRLDVSVPSDLVLAIAVARTGAEISERLSLQRDGEPVAVTEIADSHGTRLHRIEVGVGMLDVEYEATIQGRGAPSPTSPRSGTINFTEVHPLRTGVLDKLIIMLEN